MGRRRTALALGALIIAVSAAGAVLWSRGTPYQDPYWSPNREYYVQKYSNVTLSRLINSAGAGSDAVDGYIRVYDKHGNLIHERYESFIRDIEPLWSGNKVYLVGVAAMDSDPWVLPTSAQ